MLYEQIETAVIDGDMLPWVPLTPFTDQILLKYFKLDPIRGEWIVLMKSPIDMQLPKHHHTGTVMVYTLEGKWKYKEHDWIARPGSVVYETAFSRHTPEALPGTEDVIAFNIVKGELVFLDDKDQVLAVETWRTAMERYLGYCKSVGLEPRDLSSFND